MRSPHAEPMVLSVCEVAQRLGISSNLAYQLIRQGQIPAIRLGQRRIVVPIVALESWLRENTIIENRLAND